MADAADKGRGVLGFLARLFDFTLYKKTQGRRIRQATAAGFGIVVLLGCRELMLWLEGFPGLSPVVQYGVPGLIAAVAALAIFRLVNMPSFADFLIATEAEMSKVSWSSKRELKNATAVVLVLSLLMTIYLFAMDRIWETLLKFLGVLHLAVDDSGTAALGRWIDEFFRAVV